MGLFCLCDLHVALVLRMLFCCDILYVVVLVCIMTQNLRVVAGDNQTRKTRSLLVASEYK